MYVSVYVNVVMIQMFTVKFPKGSSVFITTEVTQMEEV